MFTRHWYLLLITPPITLVSGLLIAAVITYIMPVKYESTSIIEIRAQSASVDIPTEMAKLTSSTHLSQVSQDLDLITRWGTPSEASIEMLRKAIHVDQVPGTDLVRIRARHNNREDARDLAIAPAYAYQRSQNQRDETANETHLNALQAAIAEQENKVVELRERMMNDPTAHDPADPSPDSQVDLQHYQETEVLMALKVEAATISHPGLSTPQEYIIVHDKPRIAEFPISPNVRLNLTLGAGLGFLLGFPLALAIMVLLHRIATPEPK